MTAPLAGIRILDLSELLPGPYATQLLADLGAEVIKIERPPHGDGARRMMPGIFAAVNRGKASILLDLKSAADRERLYAMLGTADVLIEGYRPGVAERLGVDHASLSARNPRIISLSLTGYGPESGEAGHDVNFLARSGLLSLAQAVDGLPPATLGLPFADIAGSMFAAITLLAALRQRDRDGKGCHLQLSIADALTHWMTPRFGALLAEDFALWRRPPAYGAFACADGGLLALGAIEDHFFHRLVEVMALGEFTAPGYATYRERRAADEKINRALAARFREQPIDHWLQLLRAADLPANRVVSAAEVLHKMGPETPVVGRCGDRLLVRFPVAMADLPPADRRPPGLGESSD
jgi:CoA:oxalate CoA-transferase